MTDPELPSLPTICAYLAIILATIGLCIIT